MTHHLHNMKLFKNDLDYKVCGGDPETVKDRIQTIRFRCNGIEVLTLAPTQQRTCVDY